MSRLLTWVLRLLPALGVLLFFLGAGAFGALPDVWWDPKGFVVNLASGLTAACFGVPLAFFVLQRLLRDREGEEAQRQLVANIRDTVRRIREQLGNQLVSGLYGAGEFEEARKSVKSIRQPVRKLLRECADATASPGLPELIVAGDDAVAHYDKVEKLTAPFVTREIEHVRSLLDVLARTHNSTLASYDRPPLSVVSIRVLEDFLAWRDDYGDPELDPMPAAIERVQDFKTRVWPDMRRDAVERLKAAESSASSSPMSTADKNRLLEFDSALGDMLADLARVKDALDAVSRLTAEAELMHPFKS